MAEDSLFWNSSGVGDGAATGQTQAELNTWLRMLSTSDPATEGVCKNFESWNDLEVTNPSGRTLQIDTGAAFVHGFPYFNDSATTKTLTHPTVGTTGWRMVLRADWTAQTVRIALKESSDGTSAAPAVTQTANTTWEISLATGTITTGDVVVVTDARVYRHPPIEIENAMMAANSVDSDQYVDGSIDTAHLSDSILTADVAGRAKMADSFVNADKIANRYREFWVPPTGVYNTTDASQVQQTDAKGYAMIDNKVVTGWGAFIIPKDYTSAITITPYVVCNGANDMYTSGSATYGSVTEAYNTHTNTSAAAMQTEHGANTLGTGHMSLTLASATAGDIVHLTFTRQGNHASDTVGGTVYFFGWLVSYTADS